jgi:hypothetical protein
MGIIALIVAFVLVKQVMKRRIEALGEDGPFHDEPLHDQPFKEESHD